MGWSAGALSKAPFALFDIVATNGSIPVEPSYSQEAHLPGKEPA